MSKRKDPNKIRWTGIVKVQRPIVTNGSYCNCLIYNEERSIQTELEMHPAQMKIVFKDDALKVYMNAQLKWSGIIQLLDQVEEQAW